MGLVEFPSSPPRPPAPAAPAPPGRTARRAGWLVVVGGLTAAAIVYWIGTHRTEPDIEDLIPNYSAANSRQMGLMYGHSGEAMWDGIEALKRPGVQVAVIFVCAGAVAAVCFRIARMDEEHAAEARE